MGSKPNLFELESLRSGLIEKTLYTSSNFFRLFLYQNYFDKTLSNNDPNLEEAFLKEFLDDYISCISKFEVWGVEPKVSKKNLAQLNKLTLHTLTAENLTQLKIEIDRIEDQSQKLDLVLKGKDFSNGFAQRAYFPLIDKEAPQGFYGTLESVTVRINKTANVDKFIIVPSEKEIEKKILDQCKNSWLSALNLSKAYVKKQIKHHEVIISFDKKYGFYEGNSLGIALTISFLEQILKFYNSSYLIKIKELGAFTGGVTETGKILCTSEAIIKRKVVAVFFSEINSFVIPKCEESYATTALAELKKSFPERKLKLIPIEDISDVLNRRDVVDIKKQNIIVRISKFVKKNWISAVATVLLAILFGYLFVMDIDDNPALLEFDANILFVKNKNGKLLWTKPVNIGKEEVVDNLIKSKNVKIVDIDNDGTNEVIIGIERDKKTEQLKGSALITCYDYRGKLIWTHQFKDKVTSEREVLNTEYGRTFIIDTLTIRGCKSIFLHSSNEQSFSSAIYRLDLVTGKRLPGTFWASGHIMDGIIKDIDNDNKPEIIGVGYENGYEDLTFFAFEIDTLTKVRPTKEEYLIKDFPISLMKSYIRFPKTDFDNYYKVRTPLYCMGSFNMNDYYKKFMFSSAFPRNYEEAAIGYEINYNLKEINVVIDSDFRVQRDSLVAHGELPLPFTDTREYIDQQRNKILYWKNGKWVKREEMN